MQNSALMGYDLNWGYYEYKLAKPLVLAYGPVYSRRALVVKLSQGDKAGFGELVFIDYYNKDKDYEEILIGLRKKLRGLELTPSEFYALITSVEGADAFLASALDVAHWDLCAKLAGQALYDFLDFEHAPSQLYSFVTVSGDVLEAAHHKDWPLIKVKMGYDGDLTLLRNVLDCHEDSRLIIDANRGWTPQRTKDILSTLTGEELDRVLYLEEPLAPTWSSEYYDQIRQEFGISILADESFTRSADLEEVRSKFDAVNLKIMKVGGIIPALQVLTEAAKYEIDVIGGCMASSSIATLPIVHLSMKLKYLDVDGNTLLEHDPWGGLDLRKGELILDGGQGLGIKNHPFL